MKNIEIKARCADLNAMRRLLKRRGLKLMSQMRQIDTYFAAPHGRLKLREVVGGEAELIQDDRPDALAAHPSDFMLALITEPEQVKEVLARALGVHAVVEKRRELYLWGYTRVHLDEVAGLGSFLELETLVLMRTAAVAEAECRQVQAALGIREEELVAGSYADLLAREPARDRQ